MKKKLLTLFYFCLIFVVAAYAQPSNNESCGAIDITAFMTSDFCTNIQTFDNTGATVSMINDCESEPGVWFKFEMPVDKTVVFQTLQNGNNWDDSFLEFYEYDGDCDDLVDRDCYDQDNATDGSDHEQVIIPDFLFSPGDSVFIQVISFDEFGPFDLCISFMDQPANNECENAIDLTSFATNTLCDNPQNYSFDGANFSDVNECFDAPNVWFTIDVPADQFAVISFQQIDPEIDGIGLEIYFPNPDCADLDFVDCNVLDEAELYITPIENVDTTYYVAIYSLNEIFGDFDLCVSFLDSPANDECMDAIDVTSNIGDDSCTDPVEIFFVGASESDEVFDDFGECDDDLWYKFTVPETGNYWIEVSDILEEDGNPELSIIIADPGEPCGTDNGVVFINCMDEDNDPGTNGEIGTISAEMGQVVFLLISNDGNESIFELCVYQYDDHVSNDDCNAPQDITAMVGQGNCDNLIQTTNANATFGPLVYDDNEGAFDSDCAFRDVWYQFTVGTDGNYLIQTSQVPGSDFSDSEINVYRATGPQFCENLESLAFCVDEDNFDEDHEQVLVEDLSMGDVIYVQIAEDDGEEGAFNLCVAMVEPPVNDDCESAIDITSSIGDGECQQTVRVNTFGATDSEDDECFETDVWYVFTAPESGIYYFETQEVDPTIDDTQISVYSAGVGGDCNTLSEINECQDNDNSRADNNHEAILLELEEDEVIYILVKELDGIMGEFDLCLFKIDEPVNDDCDGAIDLTSAIANEFCENLQAINFTAATDSGNGNCGDEGDLWYKVIVPDNGNLGIGIFAEFDDNDFDYFELEVELFDNCNDLNTLTPCREYDIPTSYSFTGLTPESEVLIHLSVGDRNEDDYPFLTFDMCLFTFDVDFDNNTCASAVTFSSNCMEPTIIGNPVLNLNIDEECDDEEQAQWYTFEITEESPHILNLSYIPGGVGEFRYSLYHDDSGSECNDLNEIEGCENHDFYDDGDLVFNLDEVGTYYFVILEENQDETGPLSMCLSQILSENFCDADPLYDETIIIDYGEEYEDNGQAEVITIIFEDVPALASAGFIEIVGRLDLGNSSEFIMYNEENDMLFFEEGDQGNDCQLFSTVIELDPMDLQRWASDGQVEFMITFTAGVDDFCEGDENDPVFGDNLFSRLVVCEAELIAPIPTLGHWMLIILGILLSIIGLVTLRKVRLEVSFIF